MANELEVLMALLAVAVSFAGFTGVVTLIDRRAAHVSHAVVSFRVRNLIACVVAVMFLSVLPSVLLAFNIAPTGAWRISCAAFAVVGITYVVWVLRQRSQLTGAEQQGLNTAQFNVMVPLGVVIIVAVAAAAAGLIAASAMYVVGVFYFVLATTSYFVRLVLMLEESARGADAALRDRGEASSSL
jgi:hypothetical protein